MIETVKIFFIKILKHVLRIFRRFIPAGLIDSYEQYRKVYPLIDRSEVISISSQRSASGNLDQEARAADLPLTEIKCSLISTVRNEAGNVAEWMTSLLDQSRWPDEVVITEGGSNDTTLAILRDLAKSFPIPIQIIEAPGANISQGRNLAIQHA